MDTDVEGRWSEEDCGVGHTVCRLERTGEDAMKTCVYIGPFEYKIALT